MAKFTGNNDAEAEILATHIDPYIEEDSGTNDVTTDTETSNATSTDTTGEAQSKETPKDTATNLGDAGRGDKKDNANKGSGKPEDNNVTEEPQQKAQPQQARPPRRDGAVEDEKGGLKLPDGKYISPGAQRRFYEDNVNLRGQVQQASNILQKVRDEIIPSYERQIQTLQGEISTYKSVQTLDKQFGLSPQEMTEAVQIAAAYKSNPVQALQYLLARAQQEGHTIDGIGGGVDTMAIQQMIDRRLAPLVQDRNAQLEAQRIEQASANEANQFFSRHPDARVHESLIAQAITSHPNLSVESAYYELKLAASQRGLDWTKPLGPQMAMARQAQQQQQSVQQPMPVVPQQVAQPTIPNGRAITGQVAVKTPLAVHESTSIEDIVRSAMREAGLNA